MILTNEFTVAVPLERVWETLLEIETVAGFLPGATIEPSSEDGVYHGTMKVKVGPMTVNYKGTARLANADETQHVADIAVEATDTKGQGTASATIRNRLISSDGGTRVIAETDLAITGRQAQFGRGIMQDVAGRMLGDFAKRFEAYLLGGGEDAADAGGSAFGAASADRPASAPRPASDEALDVGSVLFKVPAVQRGLAALVALVVVLLVARRRRSG